MNASNKLDDSIQEIRSEIKELKKLIKTKDKPFLSMIECAAYTGIPLATLYGYVSKAKMPYHKVGKRTYFDKNDLDKFILNMHNRRQSDDEIESDVTLGICGKENKYPK